MHRRFLRFLGVDLGGGKGKNTAVARLEVRPDGALDVVEVDTANGDCEPFYDEHLLSYLAAHAAGAALAVDAPLTLTACVRCIEPVCPGASECTDPTIAWFRTEGEALCAHGHPHDHDPIIAAPDGNSGRRINGNGSRVTRNKPAITPYTQRATEVVLHRRHGIAPRETLGQGMGPLTARAAHLVKALRPAGYRLHENLIEVYPKATLTQLFGKSVARRYKRQAGTWETRARVLESLSDVLRFSSRSGLAREHCLQNDHCFDAVVCAYTAYLWARDGWALPEDHGDVFRADGWIYAPGVQ